jgi:hypothetical protein
VDRSLIEEAWQSTPNQFELTGWKPQYIQSLLRQLGTEYDFLFSHHSARFVPNAKKYRHGMDWAVVTIQADPLFIRFVRDRGDIGVSVAGQNEEHRWLSAVDVSLRLLLRDDSSEFLSPKQHVQLPQVASVLKERFEDFGQALSSEQFEQTRIDLEQIQKMRANGTLDVFHQRSNSGFLENYNKISDDITRVPFWKPLGIYVGMILLLPLLLLGLIFMKPTLFVLRKMREAKRRSISDSRR